MFLFLLFCCVVCFLFHEVGMFSLCVFRFSLIQNTRLLVCLDFVLWFPFCLFFLNFVFSCLAKKLESKDTAKKTKPTKQKRITEFSFS